MTADLPRAVRAEAAKAADKARREYDNANLYVSEEGRWLAVVDAVTAVVVPAALELEERAHARTSAEVARLEAENERLRERLNEEKTKTLHLGHDLEAERGDNFELSTMLRKFARLRTEYRRIVRQDLRAYEAKAARVVVLTEALRTFADAWRAWSGDPEAFVQLAALNDAHDAARAVLAAGEEKS